MIKELIEERYKDQLDREERFKYHEHLKAPNRDEQYWSGYIHGIAEFYKDICAFGEEKIPLIREIMFDHMKFGDERREEQKENKERLI